MQLSVVRDFGTTGAVKQAALSDGFAFDPFPFQHDDVAAPEVDIGGG